MTQKTKLEIIGEYRKDHPGPFCTRDGRAARIVFSDLVEKEPIVALVPFGEDEETCGYDGNGHPLFSTQSDDDLMCAREVPVAREFWVNEYHGGNRVVYDSPEKAQEFQVCLKRTIHMIEVLPGEGA